MRCLNQIGRNFYFLLCIASQLRFSCGRFPVPSLAKSIFCFNLECIDNAINDVIAEKSVIAAVVSFDIANDSYLSTYLGWWMHILGEVKENVNFLAFQPSWLHEKDIQESVTIATLDLLKRLPRNSIFFAMEHGFSSFGAQNVKTAFRQLRCAPQIILHINHEQPWTFQNFSFTNVSDFIFSTADELVDSYEEFGTVLRNYYYEPLEASSHYFPVGAPLYSYMIGNKSISFVRNPKRASERRQLCLFTGRLQYSNPITHENHNERNELWKLYNSREQTSSTQLSDLCNFTTGSHRENDFHGFTYEDYIEIMAETAFAPCPAGNNPETFRHYEALELGAIPLFVRPPSDKNFLKYGLWKNYPGPIFSNWTELLPMLSTISAREMDTMQQNIMLWYQDFIRDSKRRISRVIAKARRVSTAAINRTKSTKNPLAGYSLSESQKAVGGRQATAEVLTYVVVDDNIENSTGGESSGNESLLSSGSVVNCSDSTECESSLKFENSLQNPNHDSGTGAPMIITTSDLSSLVSSSQSSATAAAGSVSGEGAVCDCKGAVDAVDLKWRNEATTNKAKIDKLYAALLSSLDREEMLMQVLEATKEKLLLATRSTFLPDS